MQNRWIALLFSFSFVNTHKGVEIPGGSVAPAQLVSQKNATQKLSDPKKRGVAKQGIQP
ncbi:MAG: hypothetical protein HGA97_06650 [Chlorobiaceae bacterium]|nr:hypothetical protein [Chlorobiaceae bacterium]